MKQLFQLPQLLDNYEVPLKEFNHVDFIWGIDADELVYKRIFDYFNGFTKFDHEHFKEMLEAESDSALERRASEPREEQWSLEKEYYETVQLPDAIFGN